MLFVVLLAQALFVRGAAADVSMTVGPSRVELRAMPGGTGAQEIVVTNSGSLPFSVTAQVERYKETPADRLALTWLRVETSTFALDPGERKSVLVHIAAPRTTLDGGHYAQVSFLTSGLPSGGNQTNVAARLGVPFLITLEAGGRIQADPAITSFVPVLDDGGIGFHALVKNSGNQHVASRGGTVQVRKIDGSLAGRLDLPLSTAMLPETIEVLRTADTLGLTSLERYRAFGAVDLTSGGPLEATVEFSPVPHLELDQVAVRESGDGMLVAQARLTNHGEIGLLPRVQFELLDTQGQVAASSSPAVGGVLLPSASANVSAPLAGRPLRGEYRVKAHADYGLGQPLSMIRQRGRSVPNSINSQPTGSELSHSLARSEAARSRPAPTPGMDPTIAPSLASVFRLGL
ncbi:MAG: hypothetical protein ACKVVP_18615 [Chloroflexota bacterium]